MIEFLGSLLGVFAAFAAGRIWTVELRRNARLQLIAGRTPVLRRYVNFKNVPLLSETRRRLG